jgi:hypothetical protein
VRLVPLFTEYDDFLTHLLDGDLDPVTGWWVDPTSRFAPHEANLDHIEPLGNPFVGLQ